MDLLKHAFVHLVLFTTAAFAFRCGECDCQNIPPYISVICMGKQLDSLPLLPVQITYAVSEVYVNNNDIRELDGDILESWDLLSYIDLSDNPLKCEELAKINPDVEVISDCLPEPTCKYYTCNHLVSIWCIFNPITIS